LNLKYVEFKTILIASRNSFLGREVWCSIRFHLLSNMFKIMSSHVQDHRYIGEQRSHI